MSDETHENQVADVQVATEQPSPEKKKRRQRFYGPRLNLAVTQELIDQAIPRDSRHCMIAEAIRVAFPSAKSIAVDMQAIRFSDSSRRLRYVYLTPRAAQENLVRWDQAIKPDPFEFEITQAHVTRMAYNRPKQNALKNAKADAAAKTTKLGTKSHQEAPNGRNLKAPNGSNQEHEPYGRGEDPLAKARIERVGVGHPDCGALVPVGGMPPPLARRFKGEVPFSRRRAFGLRALRA